VLLEGGLLEPLAIQVPRDPVPRQLRGRHQAQALVVGLVERALAIQEVVGPLPLVSVDTREQNQVVIATRDVEWVELHRPEAFEDAQHAGGLRGQGAGRSEEVAEDQVAARDLVRNRPGHRAMLFEAAARRTGEDHADHEEQR